MAPCELYQQSLKAEPHDVKTSGRPSLKSSLFRGTHCDCSCLVWKFSNSDTCAKEEWDNLRTLFMHFISINVLLAQDQKDGGNLNFLMKVISSSFIPILRVIRLCTIRKWTWELSLWREMSYPREEDQNFKLASKSVSLGISKSKTNVNDAPSVCVWLHIPSLLNLQHIKPSVTSAFSNLVSHFWANTELDDMSSVIETLCFDLKQWCLCLLNIRLESSSG